MDDIIYNLNKGIYSNNNSILLGIEYNLKKLISYTNDNLIIKSLLDAINKINYIINENNKNFELIKNDIFSLCKELQNNNSSTIEINYKDGKYKGQIVNGLREGNGIWYGNNGDKYEGEWKNNKKEGKGIYFYNNGDRYEV